MDLNLLLSSSFTAFSPSHGMLLRADGKKRRPPKGDERFAHEDIENSYPAPVAAREEWPRAPLASS